MLTKCHRILKKKKEGGLGDEKMGTNLNKILLKLRADIMLN